MYPQLTNPLSPTNWMNMETDSTLSQSRQSSSQRRSTSSHNFQTPTLPPSMPPTLPSIAYYSLNRNRNRNNLNIENHNRYKTLSHVNSAMQNTYMRTQGNNLHVNMSNNKANDISYSDYNSTKDWSENTTVTGRSNSDYSETQALVNDNMNKGYKYLLKKHLIQFLLAILILFTFLSPVIMIVVPKMEFMDLKHSQLKCEVGCEGLQISFVFRLVILAVGSWALFYRQPCATLPRADICNIVIFILLAIFLCSFWFVYGLKYMEDRRNIKYEDIVQYASSFLNSLLCLHYLAILLLVLRKSVHPEYMLHILRSPDGESRSIRLGNMSIQEAANVTLNCYYTQFPAYNANHQTVEGKNKGQKKKAHLITSTEEAFKQLSRVSKEWHNGPNQSLDGNEAARAIFPNIIQPLQKYFKSNHQQSSHTMDSIIKHLTTTIVYGMAPKAFLEKYLANTPLLQNSPSSPAIENWSLSSSSNLHYKLKPGGIFKLRQREVVLLCRVVSIPHLDISKEVVVTKHAKFGYQGTRESPV